MEMNKRTDMGFTFTERYVYMFVLGIFKACNFFLSFLILCAKLSISLPPYDAINQM